MLLHLQRISASDRPEVGGKAYQLSRLIAAGLPVPPGFVVPVSVFRDALREAGLLRAAEDLARNPKPEEAAALRAKILDIPLPPALIRVLGREAARLGRVAVRSSGADEDGKKHSFAGQHETRLGVDPDGVPDALRACWASLYAPEAMAYRGRSGPGPGGMAVLVQRIVEPRASGVLFTVNPLNGSWREMVVESVWGLGEGLVSGHLTPHWTLVRRPRPLPGPLQRIASRVRLQVIQQDLPELTERWVLSDREVRREPVPPKLKGKPTLSRADALRLCRLGLRVERLFGEPQDVEWALTGGKFVLLQARPITAGGSPRTREDVLWTRRFIGERWPEPATPLGWSLVAPVLEWFISYPKTSVRHLGGAPPLRLHRSRPYVNVTVFRHLAFKLPGAPAPSFMLELIPPEEEAEWQRRFGVLPGFEVYASIFRETFAEKRWERFRWNPFTNHKRWDEFQARLEGALPDLSRPITSEREAIARVTAQIGWVREYVGVHITSLLFANLWYQVLESMISTWIPENAAALTDALAVCPPGNRTLETNAAIWRLAHAPPETFQTQRDAFLRAYGHRSSASWEIFSPRWADDPDSLSPLLGAQKGTEDPEIRARRQEQAFAKAKAELDRQIPRGPRRLALDEVLRLTRIYLLLRENQRFWFDRLLHATHRTLLDLGARFVARGVLDHPDDIAFLTWDEVRGVVERTLAERPEDGVRDWVERRKAQRAADRLADPPVFLRGDEHVPELTTGSRLQGIGVSPGRARGKVRILRSPAEGHRLQPGEILVAHAVDPGWTPLFLVASGVVLEMGSRLSHGAVVAREYGLPAVANLGGVTRTLVDGQEITVDGTRGIVWV